jgi:hypothetical protein
MQLCPGLKNQTAAVAVAATVGGVDNVAALDIYVAVTSVDNAVVDIYVAETGVDTAAVDIPVAVTGVDAAVVRIPVAATGVGTRNAAVDIPVAVTGVDHAVVGIPVAVTGVDHVAVDIYVAAADVANAVSALSSNFASCFLRRILHWLSVIKHTAELGCGKGLAAGIFRRLAHPSSELRPAKRVAATDCKRVALNRQNAATAGYNGRRLNGLACRYFSQVRNRGALCQTSDG